MKKTELNERTENAFNSVKECLLLILDNLNKGQRKKVLAVPAVKEMCEHFGITE